MVSLCNKRGLSQRFPPRVSGLKQFEKGRNSRSLRAGPELILFCFSKNCDEPDPSVSKITSIVSWLLTSLLAPGRPSSRRATHICAWALILFAVSQILLKISNGCVQSVGKLRLRLPAQQLTRLGNVRLPLLRVVMWQWSGNDLRR